MTLAPGGRYRSSFVPLATISWVLAGKTLIATLVVAGDPGHELLGIAFIAGCYF